MWNSLRVRLTIILVGLAIGPLLVVGTLLSQRTFAVEQDQAIDLQGQVAHRVSAEVGAFMSNVENDLYQLGNEIRNMDNPDRAQLMSVLLRALNSGDYRDVYLELRLLDAEGHESLRILRDEIIPSDELQDLSASDEFTQAKATKETYFSPVWFNDVTQESFITIAIPLYPLRSVEMSGVLVADLRLQQVRNLIDDLQLNADQVIYLTDSDNHIAVHNDASVASTDASPDLSSNAGRGPGLTADDVVFATDKVPFRNLGLIVVAERSVADALELAQNGLYVSIFVTVLALIAAVGLVALTVRQVVLPIEKLSEVARSVQAGDLSTRTDITRQDEIGHLAHAFNEMTSAIQKREDDLREQGIQREKLIQDLQAAKRMAEENSRLKSEFLSMMSHELRTPMNAIEGFTSIILGKMGGVEYNDKTEHYITRVNVNSKRLLQLINDFLDLSRVESGRLELANQAFSPADLARRWQSEIGVLAEKKNIGFELNLDPKLPEKVYGDEEAISKVAINLLGNAIKFTEQGKVSLTVSNGGDNWRIIVSDTGIGIPPHAREYIFEEFRQVDQSSKRKYGGTGLGLAIVQKYIRTMGGTVSLQSEVNEGSLFTVTLPLHTELEPVEN